MEGSHTLPANRDPRQAVVVRCVPIAVPLRETLHCGSSGGLPQCSVLHVLPSIQLLFQCMHLSAQSANLPLKSGARLIMVVSDASGLLLCKLHRLLAGFHNSAQLLLQLIKM